ncbi:cell envelope integrity TolA C-terminal domain-containing protein, partial [Citrobacter sp. VF227]
QAALTAAKTARIPKPPCHAVYEKVKDAKLDFKL